VTPLGEAGRIQPEAHRAAHVFDTLLGFHQVDDGVGGRGVELGAVGVRQAEPRTCELDDGTLQAQAQSEVRNPSLTSHPGSLDLAFDASDAKTTRHHDAVEPRYERFGEQTVDIVGWNPAEIELHLVGQSSVPECLDDRQVGVGEVDVFAHESDRDLVGRIGHLVHHRSPGPEIGFDGLEFEPLADDVVQTALVEQERHLVNARCVDRIDDRLERHVAEQADLAPFRVVDRSIRTHHDRVGMDPTAAKLGDAVLGRLGLQLLARPDVWDQGDVDVGGCTRPEVVAELPNRLQKREDLDVADRTSDLGDHHVGAGPLSELADPLLDLVGDVGNHLDGVPQVVAPPLFLDD
jgi:hypothetical protein